MKIFINIVLSVLFFSTYSCSDEIFKAELKYDSQLSKISTHSSMNINEYNCQDEIYQAPIRLDSKLVKEKKLKYSIPDDGYLHCMGKFLIFDNPLYIHFSALNPNKGVDYLEEDQVVIMYASIQKKDSTFSTVKVFEHRIVGYFGESLYAYLIENYLIIIKSIDYGYDAIVVGEDSNVGYFYNIVEITPEGKLKLMERDAGIEIFNKLDINNRVIENKSSKYIYYNRE